MPRILRWLVAATVLALAACRGAKGTPEATVKCYYDAQEAHDVDAIVDMATPESLKKAGGETKVRRALSESLVGIRGMSIKALNVATFGKEAQAQVTFSYVWRVRGKEPEPHDDEYEALYLKERDGKWYLDLPGTQRIGAY